jgi:hypothetical protein
VLGRPDPGDLAGVGRPLIDVVLVAGNGKIDLRSKAKLTPILWAGVDVGFLKNVSFEKNVEFD